MADADRESPAVRGVDRRARQMLEALPVPAWLLACDGRVVYANGAAVEAAGARLEDLRGTQFADAAWWPRSAEVRQLEGAIDDAATGEPAQFEITRRDSDGQPVPGEIRIQPLRDDEGRVEELVATVVEHRSRKQDEDQRAAHQLAASEERLRSAARAAGFGTYDVDLLAGERYWSPELEEIVGRRVDALSEAATGSVPGFVHPDDVEDVREMMARAYDPAGDGAVEHEHRIVRPDGAVRWVLVKGRVVFAGAGAARRPVRSTGIMIDTTQRKETEEARQQSEATLNAVLDALPVGVVIADANGRIVRDNAANRDIWGAPPDTASWEEYGAWVGYWPDTGRRLEAHEWAMARALRQGAVVKAELVECERFDSGERRLVLNNAAPVRDSRGRVIGGVIAQLDVTERVAAERALQESEHRLRVASSAARLGVFSWEVSGDTANWDNERMYEIFGRTREQGPLSRAAFYAQALDPADRGTFDRALSVAMQPGEHFHVVCRLRRADDGALRWAEFSGGFDFGPEGKPLRLLSVLADVTEREEAKEALRRSEQRLQLAREAARLGIHDFDVRSGSIEWDDRIRALWGMTPDEPITYEKFLDGIHPDDREQVQSAAQRALDPAGDGRYRAEYRVINRTTGVTRWVLADGQAFVAQGRPVRLIVTVQDDTDRKRAEEELIDVRDRLEVALTAGEVATWTWDIPRDRVRGDSNLAELFGVPDAERGERPLAGYLRVIHPEDRVRVGEIIRAAIDGGAPEYEAEYRVTAADGTVRWVLARGTIERDARGRALRMPGVIVDVTDRKQVEEALRESEERFRSVLENSLDAAYRRDLRSDTYDYLSPVIEQVMGVSVEQLRSMSIEALTERIHPDDRDHIAEAIERGVRTGRGRVEYRFRTPSGGYIWLADHFTVQKDPSGAPAWRGGIVRDVTKQKRIEQDLRAARVEAEAANRAKSQFLANMSHELRTPMNAVLGMTDLALREQLPAVVVDYLQTARDSGRSLLELLDQLLDFSRIEAGQMELERRPFGLRKAVTNVMKSLGLRAAEKKLELVYDIDDDVPEHVIGDEFRLRQVLVNLVGNAIKFTNEGEVAIEAALRDQRDNAIVLELAVRDTGPGIPAEDQERIFSPFAQADASTTRRHGGSGLGLAIVRNLVQMMGGEVRLQSAPGRGSTFSFTVRLELQPEAATEPTIHPLERDALEGLPVLVVAENPTTRRLLARTLAAWGMEPEVADRVPVALTKVHRAASAGEPFRLVLSDAELAEIDGFTLAAWLRQERSLAGPVILMLSGAERSAQAERCRAVEAASVEKPISPSTLFDTVVQVLGFEQAERNDRNTAEPAGPARPLRILLAEDTPANQKLAQYLLAGRGHSLAVVEDGREAVDRLQQNDFDIVLMDVQMPVMDGLSATRAIRQLTDPDKARIPIVAMTAHALQGDAERCLDAGMDAYVSKPIDGDELISMVERVAGTETTGTRPAEPPPTPPEPAHEPEKTTFDRDEAVRLCFGRYSLFQEMVALFLDEVDDLLVRLHAAGEPPDLDTLAQVSHRLKNTVVYLGAPAATAALERLDAARRSDDLPTIPTAVEQLARELERVKGAVAPYRA
jgi:PAS domain S-box-containing protein